MPLIVASFSGLFGYGRVFSSGTIVSTLNGSQYMNGETAYMVIDNTNDFRMGTGDFTVEWFQNMQYANALPRVFSMGLFPTPSFSLSFSTFISSTTDITFPTDPIFVWPSSSSSLTAVGNAIDGLSSTAYQNNTKYGSGYVVAPRAGASIVTQLAFVTAGTLPAADPLTFTLEGTNEVVTAANLGTIVWTTIVSNQATNCSETRFTRSLSAVFGNTGTYIAYRVRFPTVRDGAVATFVQIGEVEMLGSIVSTRANVWMNSSIVMNATTSTILYDAWVHFALTRSNNALRLFQNGFQLAALTSTISLTDSVNPLLIGTGLENTNFSVPLLTASIPTGGSTVLFSGTIANTGGAPVTVRGFVWSLLPNPTIALATRVQETGLFQAGAFSASTTGLLSGTTYYARAFATSYIGTGYSADVAFTTDTSAPFVSSISASVNVNNSSLVVGQIVATGGQPVTLRGFAWDTNVDPTISLSTVYTESGSFSVGFFSTFITGLSSGINYYTRALGSNVLGISYGLNAIATGALYDFTTFTFTNASVTGRSGPTLVQVQSAYVATAWTQNTAFLNMTTQGIQRWTVPVTGNYSISCAGAAGGAAIVSGTFAGGRGAVIQGTFSFTEGQVVEILVGQIGSTNAIANAGGGGGSFVVTTSGPLIIAGGGGGAAHVMAGYDANSGTSGVTPVQTGTVPGSGGTGGNGASGAVNGLGSGNNGGGYFTNGTGGGGLTSAAGSTLNGFAFVNGGLGAVATGNSVGAFGGFGGGACGYCNGVDFNIAGPGGGGGYSGGGGGSYNSASGGGGGGSFGGTLTSYNTGMGYVIVTRVS